MVLEWHKKAVMTVVNEKPDKSVHVKDIVT